MKQPIKITLAAFLLLVCLTGPVPAGQLEDGIAARERGDYAKALSLLRPLAEQGNGAAMDCLGSMYSSGRGVPKDEAAGFNWFLRAARSGNAHAMAAVAVDYEYGQTAGASVQQDHAEAVKWSLKAMKQYRKEAEKGDADAQKNLADMYATGVIKDPPEAAKWYRKAADQGNGYAQASLGILLEGFGGVQRNDAEAAKWYSKAAEQGIALAQESLGEMYAKGRGVPQDYVQAHKWLNLAAASYNTPAEAESRVKAFKNRELVAHKMTPAELAEAQRLAAGWKAKTSSH